MSISRRDLLRGGAVTVGAVLTGSLDAALAGRNTAAALAQEPTPAVPLQAGPDDPVVWFTHSVASGDPTADGVVLWTRAYPLDGRPSVSLDWVVASDEALSDIVAAGTVDVDATTDWCAKALPTGLQPHTVYWYGFSADGGAARSPAGRTKTAPAAGQDVDRLRIALLTCNNPEEGRFNALARLAEEDDTLDVVIHHGDYIYEYGGTGSRFAPWRTCGTLEDYRTRHASYRTFPQLRDAHRMHPWICLWDDGDLANGAWRDGADHHDEQLWGTFAQRRSAAMRAFLEWLPVRVTNEAPDTPMARTIAYGDLAHLVVLDDMMHRDQGWDDDIRSFDQPQLQDPDRRMLSDPELTWVTQALAASPSQWTVLVTQALVMHWGAPGTPEALPAEVADYFGRRDGNQLYGSAWNGYPAERKRLFDAIEAANLDNLVVTTGDAHMSITGELARDPYDPAVYDPATSRGSLGVEFCCASTSSAGLSQSIGAPPRTVAVGAEQASLAGNPHQRWLDLDSKGYPILELRPDGLTCDYWFVDDAEDIDDGFTFAARLTSAAGSQHLVHDRTANLLPPSRAVALLPPEAATNPIASDEIGGGPATEARGNRFPLPATRTATPVPAPTPTEPAPPLPATGGGAVVLGAAALAAAAMASGRGGRDAGDG